MNRNEKIYVIILLVVCVSLFLLYLSADVAYQELLLKQQCEMYNAKGEIYNLTYATGLYWKGYDFYCVWVKNRLFTDIERTDRHEYCHYLVDNDYDHFCFSQS